MATGDLTGETDKGGGPLMLFSMTPKLQGGGGGEQVDDTVAVAPVIGDFGAADDTVAAVGALL